MWGLLGGVVYTVVDAYLDHRFGEHVTSPPSIVEALHSVLDLVLPTITGGLLGVAVHYVRLREQMAALEKQRADSLRNDLNKIERDQAVWVISASLLHELKNPLHTLGLLLDEALELPDHEGDEQRRLLSKARSQLERIASEVAALRVLPDAARPALPNVELKATLSAVVDGLRSRAPGVSIVCRAAQPVLAKANPAYLRIILENLLENAVDAMSGSGSNAVITVQLHPTEQPPGCAVEVYDDGPGIDTKVVERLFEPLCTTKAEGMGLGLAIARTLARSMGGDLTLLEREHGAGFRLTLTGPSR